MSHGSGLYMMPYDRCRRGCQWCRNRRLRCRPRLLDSVRRWPQRVDVRGADDGEAPGRPSGDRAAARDNLRTIIWGGAPMYVADVQGRDRPLRPALRADLRPGREPDDHHRHDRARCSRTSDRAGDDAAARLGGPAAQSVRRGADRRRARCARCRRARPARSCARGDSVMAGYWRNAEASAATLRGGWLHTGDVGASMRDGYPHLQRPLQGPDHLRRLEHLSARGRGGAAAPPRRARVLGHRRAGCRMGRGRGRLRRRALRRRRRAAALDRLCLENIARFKRPKDYRFVEALPKNNYGKILKTELRELAKRG